MLLANAKMLWRKVAGKYLDLTRNDPSINWLNGLNCLVWRDIAYILIHFLPNSHILLYMCFITVYIHLCYSVVNKKLQKV